jgi:hypothetical protein
MLFIAAIDRMNKNELVDLLATIEATNPLTPVKEKAS